MKWLAWLALSWLVLAAGSALAAGRSVSYSTWIVSGNLVTLRLRLPLSEARRLVGVAVPVLTTDRLKDYVLQHATVASSGGSCPAIDQGYDLGRVDPLNVGPDLYGFELVYRCRDSKQLVLKNTVLFATVPDHIDFASIRAHGQVVQQLFTAGRQQLTLPDSTAPAPAAMSAYVRIGLVHVLDSFDRWCVLMGAVLLVRRWREVGAVVVCLAGGYLLSLALSSSGWVVPRLNLVEACVGLLVALLGAVLAWRDGPYRTTAILGWTGLLALLALTSFFMHAPWAAPVLLGGAMLFAGVMLADQGARAARAWWVLMALFAFLDGVVMAAVLPLAQLPRRSLIQVQLGFDAGAWVAEAVLVALIAALVLFVRTPRLHRARLLCNEFSAAALNGVGVFWLVSRLWA
ncbi:MAG TPA: HupE/UreJ family protein [Steroidobacteraceae bacterium]|nr:HupE/UreJ family protein [Steroidobacteraceae bacterium]